MWSTYEKNQTREEERRTASHNTVVIDGLEQTDVWGGFRVGRRAQPNIIEDSRYLLEASHNGYQYNQIRHARKWILNKQSVEIVDNVDGNKELSLAYFHFNPQLNIKQIEDGIFVFDDITLIFSHFYSLRKELFTFCAGFNKIELSTRLIVSFTRILNTKFKV